MLFKNFEMTNDEILEIINEYMPLINKYSYIDNRIDEDLKQEIIFEIFMDLRKNYKENEKQ